jgi:hypothetical protein
MTIPIGQFTIHREGEGRHFTLVGELSDFGPAGTYPFHQIYPDACDEGVTVQGKSGAVDYCVSEWKVEDGDLQKIILLPTPESVKRVPGAAGSDMVLYND